MADYSKVLFSYKGAEPDFLPNRLRLPDNTTRYSYEITLEELDLLGYLGPIPLPDYNENQHLCWCCHNLCYDVEEGPDPCKKISVEDNNTAKAILLSRIKNSYDSIDESNIFTQEFKEKYGVYKGKLLDLYFKKEPETLDVSDIPEQPTIHCMYEKDRVEYLSAIASGQIDLYKRQYEEYGVVLNIDSRLVDWLPLPGSDWVKGSGLLYDSTSINAIASGVIGPLTFGRHCFE